MMVTTRLRSFAAVAFTLLFLAISAALPSTPIQGSGSNSFTPTLSPAHADPNPTYICNDLAERHRLGRYRYTSSEPATGRKYRGGTSYVRHYSFGECHYIYRNGVIIRGPHIRDNWQNF